MIKKCSKFSSKIWEPKSAEENSAPDSKYDYFLGIAYLRNESRWIYLSDYSNVTYFNWAPDQPSIRSSDMTCVIRNEKDNLWYTIPCYYFSPVFCQLPLGRYNIK